MVKTRSTVYRSTKGGRIVYRDIHGLWRSMRAWMIRVKYGTHPDRYVARSGGT